MPRFTLFRRGHLERSFELQQDEIFIGRQPGIDIPLVTSTVSRKHARIARDGQGFVVEDLGSVNGTHVRDDRVVLRRPLEPGDNVRIEDYVLVFEPPDEIYAEGLRLASDDVTAPRSLNITFLSSGRFAAPEAAKTGDPEKPPGKRGT